MIDIAANTSIKLVTHAVTVTFGRFGKKIFLSLNKM